MPRLGLGRTILFTYKTIVVRIVGASSGGGVLRGIVNLVSKSGTNNFHGTASANAQCPSEEQPLDNLAPLAKANVPLLHVCGHRGPWFKELEVEKRYKKLGGKIQVIVKKGEGHYPLAPEDPAPVVNFITQQACRGIKVERLTPRQLCYFQRMTYATVSRSENQGFSMIMMVNSC
jgi:hypothetical protein